MTDDRADNRILLCKMLTSVGFDVEEASDGMEAIEKTETFLPDVIFMDIRMPEIDGYEAIRRIRAKKGKDVSIIAATASAFYEDWKKIMEAGADAYLRKPFKEQELFQSLQSCISVQYIYEGDIQ